MKVGRVGIGDALGVTIENGMERSNKAFKPNSGGIEKSEE